MMRPATIFLGQRRRGDGLARAKEGSGEESARASAFFFEKIGGYKIRNHRLKKSTIFAMLVLRAKKVITHISILSKVAYYGNYIRKYKKSASETRINAGRLGEESQYQILYPYEN